MHVAVGRVVEALGGLGAVARLHAQLGHQLPGGQAPRPVLKVRDHARRMRRRHRRAELLVDATSFDVRARRDHVHRRLAVREAGHRAAAHRLLAGREGGLQAVAVCVVLGADRDRVGAARRLADGVLGRVVARRHRGHDAVILPQRRQRGADPGVAVARGPLGAHRAERHVDRHDVARIGVDRLQRRDHLRVVDPLLDPAAARPLRDVGDVERPQRRRGRGVLDDPRHPRAVGGRLRDDVVIAAPRDALPARLPKGDLRTAREVRSARDPAARGAEVGRPQRAAVAERPRPVPHRRVDHRHRRARARLSVGVPTAAHPQPHERQRRRRLQPIPHVGVDSPHRLPGQQRRQLILIQPHRDHRQRVVRVRHRLVVTLRGDPDPPQQLRLDRAQRRPPRLTRARRQPRLRQAHLELGRHLQLHDVQRPRLHRRHR